MCDKDVNACPSITQFVPKNYKAQKISNNAVNRCFDVRDSIPDWYKTQKMSYLQKSYYANILP